MIPASREHDFKKKEKLTHKMTRDGLVEKNATTGAERNVSKRCTDFDLRTSSAHEAARPEIAKTNKRKQSHPDVVSGLEDHNTRDEPDSVYSDQQPIPAKDIGGLKVSNTHSTEDKRNINEKSKEKKDAVKRSIQRGFSDQRTSKLQGQNIRRDTDIPKKSSSKPQYQGDSATPSAYEKPSKLREQSASRDVPSTDEKPSKLQEHSVRHDIPTPDSVAEKPKPDKTRKQHKNVASGKGKAADKLRFEDGSRPAGDGENSSADAEEPADQPKPPGKKLKKAQRKADNIDTKLGKAQKNLPTKRRIESAKIYDEKKGKVTRKFYFEEEVKSKREHLKGPVPLRPVKAAGNAAIGVAHKKVHQAEDDNVGVKAAHKGEIAAEVLARSALRHKKLQPYRRVKKLEKASAKSHVKLQYQKTLHENPDLKSSFISRRIQKQKIKRQYAQAARDAKNTAKATKKAAENTSKAIRRAAGIIKHHPAIAGIITVIAAFMILFAMTFSSCSGMMNGMMGTIFLSSYTADDLEIDAAELHYTELETDLQIQVNSIEANYPGYDEYRWSVGDIDHNPFELMAFLTAVYGDFKFNQIRSVLDDIFSEQYSLSIEVVTEIKTRTVTKTDPDTGESYQTTEEYEWHVLVIDLNAKSFSLIAYSRMDDEQRDMFGVYMATKGNRQYLDSPFDFNWLPHLTSKYGYRIHPISGQKNYHKAVDIGVPSGTEILAGHDGTVTAATFDSGYGNYIVLDNGKGLVSKYAHCATLLVSAGQTVESGDVIATVGSTGNSTGPHLHLEILMQGHYLNPIFFAETNDDGSGPNYGDPGAPMGEGTYGDLIAEAEKHLGKPYVFGAAGPNAFDCSSFVCWVFTYSGVYNMPRTTAQGIYNQCTPVSPSDAQPGDIIFFHSTYSTSDTVTHVGIYVGNGQMIHCGKPIQYTSINSPYWQQHFYAFGRIG